MQTKIKNKWMKKEEIRFFFRFRGKFFFEQRNIEWQTVNN